MWRCDSKLHNILQGIAQLSIQVLEPTYPIPNFLLPHEPHGVTFKMILYYSMSLFIGLQFTVDAYPESAAHGLLQNRQVITAVDPFDHTWIGLFTALGDSYAVGLGAGHYIKTAPLNVKALS
jgi:hypothetical protein